MNENLQRLLKIWPKYAQCGKGAPVSSAMVKKILVLRKSRKLSIRAISNSTGVPHPKVREIINKSIGL